MRRFVVRSAFVTVCAVRSVAMPNSAEAQFSGGIKLGLASTTLRGSDSENPGSLTGLVVGASFVRELTPSIGIQPEILINAKGAEDSEGGTAAKLRIRYVSIPVLVRVQSGNLEAQLRPFAIAGPTVGFKTGCKVTIKESGITSEGGCDDFEFDVKSLDYGVVFGIGTDYSSPRALLSVDLRYDMSVTTIDSGSPAADVRNRGLVLMAGFRIPLGQGSGVELR